MIRQFLAVASVLLFSSSAIAQMKIEDVKARHGRHGPERASLDVIPGDEVVFTYNVIGLRAKDKIDFETSYKVTNADGKVVLDNKSNQKEILALGGGQATGWIALS